jgi:hypothetical protein
VVATLEAQPHPAHSSFCSLLRVIHAVAVAGLTSGSRGPCGRCTVFPAALSCAGPLNLVVSALGALVRISHLIVVLVTALFVGCQRDESPRKLDFAAADAAEVQASNGTGGQPAEGNDQEQTWRAEVTAQLESLAKQCVQTGEEASDVKRCFSLANSALIFEAPEVGYVKREAGNQIGLLYVYFDQSSSRVTKYDVNVTKWEGHWQN